VQRCIKTSRVLDDTLGNVAWVAVLLCFVVFVVILTSLQTMAWHLEWATETLCGQADCALDGAMMRCVSLHRCFVQSLRCLGRFDAWHSLAYHGDLNGVGWVLARRLR
jgi:hypothetical protein